MILALLLGVALAAAPAVPLAGPPAAPPTGDWIVYGDNVEPSSLNWLRATDRPSRQVCRLIADSLIDFDQSFRFVPRLARSFEVAPDGMTITFHLRSGVSWHDGKPFSAKDVAWTIDTMRRLDPQGDQFQANFGPLREDAHQPQAVDLPFPIDLDELVLIEPEAEARRVRCRREQAVLHRPDAARRRRAVSSMSGLWPWCIVTCSSTLARMRCTIAARPSVARPQS